MDMNRMNQGQNGYQQDMNMGANMGYQNQGMNQGYPNYQQGQAQNGYQQAPQAPQKSQKSVVFDKKGVIGVSLMTYVILGLLLFAGNMNVSLVILTAVVILTEKNKDLTEFFGSLVFISVAIDIICGLITRIVYPFGNLGYTVMENARYASGLYKFGELITKMAGWLDTLNDWVYTLIPLVLAFVILGKVNKGTFKAPKIISKYIK